jgi:hypothetical protein
MFYVLVGIGSSIVGFIGGFFFGSIHGCRFAHYILKKEGRLKDVPPPAKANQDFQ